MPLSTLRLTTIAIAAVLLLPRIADATELTAEQVAQRVGGDMVAADISTPRTSPDGTHVSFLHDAHLRYENPPPYDIPAPPCSDVWVARVDGSQLTRLTTVCEARGTYETRGGGGDWTPDGAVLTWRSSQPKGAYSTARATVSIGAGGQDVWTTRSYAGYPLGYSADGRFWLLEHVRDLGYVPEYTAVDLTTGVPYVMWNGGYSGTGRWTEACAGSPAPLERSDPTRDQLIAAISGAAPSCTFVPRPAAPMPTPTPTPAPTPTPTPSPLPLTPTAARAPQILAATTSLRRAERLGFTVRYSADGVTRARGWIYVGRRVVARGSATDGQGIVQLAPTRALRSTFRGQSATVRLSLTDPAGTVRVVERRFELRR